MTTFAEVQQLIAATLKVPGAKITPTLRNEDLMAWDSLGQVNLMIALEQTFNLYIEVEEFSSLTSVPAILEFLNSHGA
jgi:acyl carrier protein